MAENEDRVSQEISALLHRMALLIESKFMKVHDPKNPSELVKVPVDVPMPDLLRGCIEAVWNGEFDYEDTKAFHTFFDNDKNQFFSAIVMEFFACGHQSLVREVAEARGSILENIDDSFCYKA